MHRSLILAALLAAAVGVAGCEGAPPPEAASPDMLGSISVQLQVGSVIRFDSVAYDITGPAFHTTGTLNVANSTTVSGVIPGIPFGSGYTMTLSAVDATNPASHCQGSATFDIHAAAPVGVMVHLTCQEAHMTTPPPPPAVPLSPSALAMLALLLVAIGGRVCAATRPGQSR